MAWWHLVALLVCFSGSLVAARKNDLLFQSEKVEAPKEIGVSVGNATCLNPKYFCAPLTTCCNPVPPIPTKPPTCCPYNRAVCCRDGIHCCPFGSQCDMIHRGCVRSTGYGMEFLPFAQGSHPLEQASDQSDGSEETKEELSSIGEVNTASDKIDGADLAEVIRSSNHQGVSEVVCPGGVTCADGQTCCKDTKSGIYKCCMYANAVCCSDGTHCCPNSYRCDFSTKTCVRRRTYTDPFHLNWLEQPASPLA